jgi:4'-phosphopantetheinyl transferase
LEVYGRYKVDLKKSEFLIGRVLAKSVLSKYLGIRPESIYFIKNNNGKLFLADHLRYKTGEFLQFNIAHSHNMVVCAITLENEIGVDVEKVSGPILDIAERFFAVGELEYIAKCESEGRSRTAYKIWTLKEAFIKAKGLGLSMALDSFDITLLDKDVYLKCIEPKPGYYVSVAVDSHENYNFQTRIVEITDISKLINGNVLKSQMENMKV